jgi:AraC-like DNA-binding protein
VLRRGRTAHRHWELATPALPAPLGALVSKCCGYRERSDAEILRTELPVASVVVTLVLGDPIEVGGQTMTTGFLGGFTDVVSMQRSTRQEGIELFLTPAGASALFGVAPADTVDRVVSLDAMAQGPRELVDRLRDQPSWEQRFAILEAWLVRGHRRHDPQRLVEWMLKELRQRRAPRLEALARASGYTSRHLSRVFSHHVGVSPKRFARLARFQDLVAHVRHHRCPSGWARLAWELGYSDQAHLIRDVRHFAGATPAALAGRLDVFAPEATDA